MSPIPRYGESGQRQRKTPAVRRTWTAVEEQELIYSLKEIITSGWKADNGFRPGYLQVLEQALNGRLPTSKIEVKHINSKLTVWKKTYYQLLGMQGTSGFGWNETGSSISVSDDIWALYVRAHPDVANMRFKSYVYYEDWVEIFGKDRATGDEAEDFVEIVQDLVRSQSVTHKKDKGKEAIVDADDDAFLLRSPHVDLTTEASDGCESQYDIPPYNMGFDDLGPKPTRLTKKGKKEMIKPDKPSKKRKTPEAESPDPYKPDMEKFVCAAKSAWGDLSQQFAKEEDSYDEKAQKIITALDNIESLTEENRIFLSFKIMDNAKHVSLFLKSSERNREHISHMMIQGKMP